MNEKQVVRGVCQVAAVVSASEYLGSIQNGVSRVAGRRIPGLQRQRGGGCSPTDMKGAPVNGANLIRKDTAKESSQEELVRNDECWRDGM